ncbi:MAG: hypothetical protein LBF51_08320 [Zoogloeaceae bacterium]|nr:hypothetical protein [Zoogloeaceae bacterium]
MSDNETPSQDPADAGSLAGVLSAVFKKQMQGVDGMLPAAVVRYDRQNNTATVRPLIQVMGTDGKSLGRSLLLAVPVLALGGGGFVVNFPLKPGDLGWIEASDRDISLFVQALAEAKPNTCRLHSFSDGRFIPDVFRRYVIDSSDADDMVIQTIEGNTRIVVRANAVDIKTSGDVAIDAGGKIGLAAAASITLAAPVVTIAGDVSVEGRGFMEHVHTGVEPGPGNTGGVA